MPMLVRCGCQIQRQYKCTGLILILLFANPMTRGKLEMHVEAKLQKQQEL